VSSPKERNPMTATLPYIKIHKTKLHAKKYVEESEIHKEQIDILLQ